MVASKFRGNKATNYSAFGKDIFTERSPVYIDPFPNTIAIGPGASPDHRNQIEAVLILYE